MRILWLMKKQLDVAMDRTVRLEMIRALRSQGHDVTFVTGYRHSREDFGLGDSLRYLDSSPLPFLHHAVFSRAVARELPRLAAELSPDAVVLDPWTTEPASGWLRRRDRAGGPAVVVDVRTLPVGVSGLNRGLWETFFRRGVRATSSLADGVSAITDAMYDALVESYGLDAALPHAVWTSGVAVDRFDPHRFGEEHVAEGRRRLGVPPDAFVVMYHGSLTRERGLGELLRSLTADAGGHGGVHLLLVGGGADAESLTSEAGRLGLSGRVHHLPPVPNEEMPGLVALADAGVLPFPDLPGWRVSSPIKLFEYLAMEKPVILTDIVAHRYAADGLEGAVFAPSNEPGSLAAAAARLAALSREEIRRMGRAGREHVTERHTWERQAERLAAFLGRCAERGVAR